MGLLEADVVGARIGACGVMRRYVTRPCVGPDGQTYGTVAVDRLRVAGRALWAVCDAVTYALPVLTVLALWFTSDTRATITLQVMP